MSERSRSVVINTSYVPVDGWFMFHYRNEMGENDVIVETVWCKTECDFHKFIIRLNKWAMSPDRRTPISVTH